MPAISLLSPSSSPQKGHIPGASGGPYLVPALAAPSACPASRLTGPKLNGRLTFHSAHLLASPFFYPLHSLHTFINMCAIY